MSRNNTADKNGVHAPAGSGAQDNILSADGLGGKGASAALRSPLYHQIYLILRDKILSAEYPNGTVLAGEFELANQYRVSRITVKRALDELAADGLVTRERGRGTTVTHEGRRPTISAPVEGQLEDLLSMGYETQVRLVDFAYVPAPPDAAAALQCETGAEVQRAVRTWSASRYWLCLRMRASVSRRHLRPFRLLWPIIRLRHCWTWMSDRRC